MIHSHNLFRTLTLVGIATFIFVLGVSTMVSGLFAHAKTSNVDLSRTYNQKNVLNNPRLALGRISPVDTQNTKSPLSDASMDDNKQGEDGADSSVQTEDNSTETPKELHQKAQRRAQSASGDTPVMTAKDKREILWLARIVYSETKRSHEQRLVAWVVRNRVDTGYTGRTYESVANHASQFSGLHPSDSRYQHNMSRYWASQGESWRSALKIAKQVYFASESERPFSKKTRHFYSPISVYDKPAWAYGREAVWVIHSRRHNKARFAFYSRVR